MCDININPTFKEMIVILISRILNSCSNVFRDIAKINNRDNIAVFREFTNYNISNATKKCITHILRFRNDLEHDNNFLNSNINNKLDMLLLSFMRLSNIYKIEDFNRIIATFNFLYEYSNNTNYSDIRNAKLDDNIIDMMFYISKVNINYLRYNKILHNNCFYNDDVNTTLNEQLLTTMYDVINNIKESNYALIRSKLCFKSYKENRYFILVGDDKDITFYDTRTKTFVSKKYIDMNIRVHVLSII